MSRVMVVDDERNIRMLLRVILEGAGHEVREAGDGAAALSVLKDDRFDLVVLDLNMPVMDGIAVLEAIQREAMRREAIQVMPRVVVITAYGSVAAAVRAVRQGAAAFLEKPLTPKEVRDTVAEAIREPVVRCEGAVVSGVEGLLDEVRGLLEASNVKGAEALLARVNVGQKVASYCNLLGVLHEMRGEERLARKMYSKAFGAEPGYGPAEQNLRRIYELRTFGRTDVPVALGERRELQFR